MEGKNCTKCGEWKVLEAFTRDRRRADGTGAQCKLCKATYVRERAAACPLLRERARRQARSRYYANPKAASARNREWRANNMQYGAAANRRRTEQLLNSYIAGLLNSSVTAIPPELIEAKRIQLQIKRYLKNGNE